MSGIEIDPSITFNNQIQQKNSKSKSTFPVAGAIVGAGVGIGTTAVGEYNRIKPDIMMKSAYIDTLQKSVSDNKVALVDEKRDFMRKSLDISIKTHESMIQEQKAEVSKLKQSLKPSNLLKTAAKSPITYIVTATGLAVGLVMNHLNNKKAEASDIDIYNE